MEQSFGSEKIFFPMHYFHDLSLQVHPSQFLPDTNHKLATLLLEKKKKSMKPTIIMKWRRMQSQVNSQRKWSDTAGAQYMSEGGI